ncbi:MAG: CocE/NonD family hydrolase [Bacteroidetes Order II. Incertae sedis bacterium]|nr:CocE/NonD family hydrolase [Bacteroidetes Order II. bacterium]
MSQDSLEDLKDKVLQIATGRYYIEYQDVLFVYNEPSIDIEMEASCNYKKYYKEAVGEGFLTEEGEKEMLISNMVWVPSDDRDLAQMAEDMQKLRSNRSDYEFQSNKLKAIDSTVSKLEEEVTKMLLRKNSFISQTARYQAIQDKFQYVMRLSLKDIHGRLTWPTQEDMDNDCDMARLNFFINCIFYEKLFSEKAIRKIARSEPWRTTWKTSTKTGTPLFNKSSSEMTGIQNDLCHWSMIYDSVFESIDCSKKVMIGPWNHSRPDVAIPGPRIDYLLEMRRWFDLHLKNEDDGVSGEAAVNIFVQQFDSPNPARLDSSGSWHSENSWPVSSADTKRFYLGGADISSSRRLFDKPVVSMQTTRLIVDPAVGTTSGLWSGGLPFGLPDDQKRDEALSLSYTTPPLQEELVIAGTAELELFVSSNSPNPLFVAKIMDVAPNGESALICRGILNGSRIDQMRSPSPMTPEHTYEVSVKLDTTAWKIRRGHRLRLSISGSDFPNSWPSASGTTIKLETGGDNQSSLVIPTLTGEGAGIPEFAASAKTPPPHIDDGKPQWSISENPMNGEVTVQINRSATTDVRSGVEFLGSDSLIFAVDRTDGAQARAEGTSVSEVTYRNTSFRSEAIQQITSDETHFHWRTDLSVMRDGKPVHQRIWEKSFPRDMM